MSEVKNDFHGVADPRTYGKPSELNDLMRRIRQNDPVTFIEIDGYKPFWAVSKHADIMEVERNSSVFINAPRSILMKQEAEDTLNASGVGLRSLVNMDNPDHKIFRDLTKEWFLPKNLRLLEPKIHEIAAAFVDKLIAETSEVDGVRVGECDFVNDIAVWYPLRVIMMILGVPEEDEALMLKLTQELFGAEDPDMQREAASDDDRMQTLVEFYNYFNQVTADRRANPGEDVASVIANAVINGEPIGELEAISYYVIVATAGHDTTSSSTSGGLLALLQHPEAFAKLRSDPKLMAAAVDESIRWSTPVKHFMRTAAEDYSLRGKQIKAGDALMMMYASANRDEDSFDEPEIFKIDRKSNKHLSFGYGPHFCLGYMLAKMEMTVLYEELFKRVENIELAGDPAWVQSAFVSGLKTLPIRFTVKEGA